MSFETLTEDEEREAFRLFRFYWREAERCEGAKAYLAGSVMAASALEAMLMTMVNVYADEAEATGAAPMRKSQIRALRDWDLGQLVKVAKAADWLPFGLDLSGEWDGRKAKIGDFVEVARMVRNLVHPGYYLREHSPSRLTAKYLKRQLEILDACRERLMQHNNKELVKRLEQKELS